MIIGGDDLQDDGCGCALFFSYSNVRHPLQDAGMFLCYPNAPSNTSALADQTRDRPIDP
jgi:hypothetical protein